MKDNINIKLLSNYLSNNWNYGDMQKCHSVLSKNKSYYVTHYIYFAFNLGKC